ncbi:MAG: hypothetical protein IPN50_03365 [Sphingomonadales bacterium]|nr:hypothetical protein [Sphingomonadales bacterium]
MRTMEETAQALNTALPPLMMGLMFLPGMYFWTAAIGKDAPLFLACALAVWSCFHISSRGYWVGLAIGIMVLIRAHVALLSVVALALALVAGRGVPSDCAACAHSRSCGQRIYIVRNFAIRIAS